VLECDVWYTSDGVPVVMHDETVDRTTDGTGAVASLTAAQVAALTVDPTKAGYARQGVPTLHDLIATFAGRAIIVPEFKEHTDHAARAAACAAEWRASGWLDSIIVQSFWGDILDDFHDEGVQTMVLHNSAGQAAAIAADGHGWVGHQFTTGTAGELALIAESRAAGLKVATYTQNSYTSYWAAVAAGSDMPMTDFPWS